MVAGPRQRLDHHPRRRRADDRLPPPRRPPPPRTEAPGATSTCLRRMTGAAVEPHTLSRRFRDARAHPVCHAPAPTSRSTPGSSPPPGHCRRSPASSPRSSPRSTRVISAFSRSRLARRHRQRRDADRRQRQRLQRAGTRARRTPRARPPAPAPPARCSSSASSAGALSRSYRFASAGVPRSAANRNCIRSFDPIDTKSATSISFGAAGTAAPAPRSCEPIASRSGAGRTFGPPRPAASARAARNSATVATIGNITLSGRPVRRQQQRAELPPQQRRPVEPDPQADRQPIAGFSSVCGAASGSSLSPPRSSVRNRTGRSPAASSTRA